MTQMPPQQPFPQGPYGQPPGQPAGAYSMPPQRQMSAAAVVSLVCGILGCLPFITGLIAVICGIVGIKTTSNPRYSGKGLAIAGLILGLISLAFWGLMGGSIFAAFSYTRPVRQGANQFARDLSAGNISAAQAMCSSSVTQEELKTAADALKPLGALKDTTMPVSVRSNMNGVKTADAAGAATFSGGETLPYFIRFVWQGGSMKVDGFVFQSKDKTITGGVKPKTSGS